MPCFSTFGFGGGMLLLGWVIPFLVVALLALGIAALWKYVQKK